MGLNYNDVRCLMEWRSGGAGGKVATLGRLNLNLHRKDILKLRQLFAGNALSGIGHHRTRLLQTLSSAGLNIALNIALIPSMSWQGSAVATIVTELYLVVLHWRTLWRLASRAEESPPTMVAATT